MTLPRTVVLNGDLGSGKTTVSVLLAERLGVRRVSIGDFYRRMAAEHGMTVREWTLFRLLGVTELEHGKPGRKPKTTPQQELPMAG